MGTQHKIGAWKHHLKILGSTVNKFDTIWIFSRYLQKNCVLGQTLDSHISTNSYALHVKKYIQEELQFGAIIDPFDRKPCTLHISTFMTGDKTLWPGSTLRMFLLLCLSSGPLFFTTLGRLAYPRPSNMACFYRTFTPMAPGLHNVCGDMFMFRRPFVPIS